MKELDAEWEKLEGRAVPTRFIRSEQAAAEAAATSGGGGGGEGGGGDDDDDEGVAVSAAPVEIDPYDLADPVDMHGKMPKNFYEQLVHKHNSINCTCMYTYSTCIIHIYTRMVIIFRFVIVLILSSLLN